MDALGNEVMSRAKDDLTRLLRLMDAALAVARQLRAEGEYALAAQLEWAAQQ